jgi:hypothetical protein
MVAGERAGVIGWWLATGRWLARVGAAGRGGAAGGRRPGEARDGGSSKCDRESELTGRVWNIAEN